MNSKSKHPVPALFERLGMPSVKTCDEFTITYKDGLLEASVKRRSGKVETITQTISGKGFSQLTNFNPNEMSQTERNAMINKLYNDGRGDSQSKIAKTFGLTQSQVSRIIKNS
ncbi:hypothetical protein [Planctobacterium marinum]|uniref:hypothetical protein n=1 Tax=Planctobacterium marinum TaxID=1631968 RepID=UPI001E37EF44|nr:hypothetical protein [Planctobacterium marinum]MCC2607142.1 hypothetical protein [Planctobacterium marinum]